MTKLKKSEISDYNRPLVEELQKKFPNHRWIGPKYELISCSKCGLSAFTPRSACTPLEGKKK